MQNWVVENTCISDTEYDSWIDKWDRKKIELARTSGLILDKLDDYVKNMRKEEEGIGLSSPIDLMMKRVELFTEVYRKNFIYNLLLAKKMEMQKTDLGWSYKGINFWVLSDYLPYHNKILRSKKRLGMTVLGAVLAIDCDEGEIVVARITDLNGNSMIHNFSVIKGFVWDPTKNLIMRKEDYYELYQVNVKRVMKPEELERLGHEFIQAQKGIYDVYIDHLEFMCFPEEIIEGLKQYKNKREDKLTL